MTSDGAENALAKSDLPGEPLADVDLQRAVETKLAPNLQRLPPQDRQHVIEEVTMMMVSMAGPLPPPVIARQYEEMCPGFVDRSLKMAETAQRAEIDASADERQKNQNYRIFGMACAGVITLTLIASGVYIAINVNVYAGVLTALITFVASAVAAFIKGRPLADGVKEAPLQPKKHQPAPAKRRAKRP
jgi:uncharacterized membrane protein